MDRKVLRDLLVPYNYQSFKKDLATWMVSGRMVWGFFGNFLPKTALEIVESARDQLKLKCTARADLMEFKVADVPKGEHRVDFKIEDVKNENSCLVTYFQDQLVDASNLKRSLMTDMTI
jgi:hypothetical protein